MRNVLLRAGACLVVPLGLAAGCSETSPLVGWDSQVAVAGAPGAGAPEEGTGGGSVLTNAGRGPTQGAGGAAGGASRIGTGGGALAGRGGGGTSGAGGSRTAASAGGVAESGKGGGAATGTGGEPNGNGDPGGDAGSGPPVGAGGAGVVVPLVTQTTTSTHLARATIDPGLTDLEHRDDCVVDRPAFDASGAPDIRAYRLTRGSCDCEQAGLLSEPADLTARLAADYLVFDSLGNPYPDVCLCGVPLLAGAELESCQNDVNPQGLVGFCYVEPGIGQGNSDVLTVCPAGAQTRMVRVFAPAPTDGPILRFPIDELVAQQTTTTIAAVAAPLGAPCLPSLERLPDFGGFSPIEATIETNTAACDSGVCVANYFQGRTSCPYGQVYQPGEDPGCFLPGTQEPVSVEVSPQLLARPAKQAVACSCQCDGPGPGPFCRCPSNMACAPLVAQSYISDVDPLVGSYCVLRDMVYDPDRDSAPAPDTCASARLVSSTKLICGDPPF